MPVSALTGNDTIQIAGRVLRNFGEGDVIKLTFPNDLAQVKTGKAGNAIFAAMASGQQSEAELKVLRGSDDDAFLNALLTQQRRDFPSFPLMDGYLVKRIGDGSGKVGNDTYLLAGGVFTKIPETAENTEGATDPAQATYHLKFANCKRANM